MEGQGMKVLEEAKTVLEGFRAAGKPIGYNYQPFLLIQLHPLSLSIFPS